MLLLLHIHRILCSYKWDRCKKNYVL